MSPAKKKLTKFPKSMRIEGKYLFIGSIGMTAKKWEKLAFDAISICNMKFKIKSELKKLAKIIDRVPTV